MNRIELYELFPRDVAIEVDGLIDVAIEQALESEDYIAEVGLEEEVGWPATIHVWGKKTPRMQDVHLTTIISNKEYCCIYEEQESIAPYYEMWPFPPK